MKAIELYFNPKKEKETIFESFIYEPENAQEKIKGNFYIVCEITNALPQNFDLPKNLAEIIKKEYYASSEISFEQSFKNALKKANEFLNEKIENNNVSWLGNLNCAVLSIVPQENAQNCQINFTKYGDIKILLLKSANNSDSKNPSDVEIIDVSSNIETQKAESTSSKIFENIVAGKLEASDKIMLLTKNTFEFFKNQNLIEEIGACANEKKINKILKQNKKNLLQTSGVCVFIYSLLCEGADKALINKKHFSFPSFPEMKFPKINIPKIKLPMPPKKDGNQLDRKSNPFSPRKFFSPNRKKFIILTIILILTLSIGFLIFQKDKQQKVTSEKMNLEQIQAKITQAQNALIFKDEEQANLLLQQAWNEVTPYTEDGYLLKSEAEKMKNIIERELTPLIKLENIENPEIVSGQENLFFQENLSAPVENSFALFSEPNKLSIVNNNGIEKSVELENFPSEFEAINLCSYNNHLYFLLNNNQIIKYPYSGDLIWGEPESWLDKNEQTNLIAKSMAIDGSIWILDKSNEIKNYHNNVYRKTLESDIFPEFENPVKIYTSVESLYLYILEPCKNRIIILWKDGKISKQFQSEKFNSLKDFSVSNDEKTIYLLSESGESNDPLIYKIQI
jgi:hypothetical protein